MKNDLISIIVLAYNTEKYIKKCLDSILKQTYTNFEIIVILDGCIDKTSNIVNNLAKKDNRIKIINHENKGTCYCRIEGYKESLGKYIMYIDSDDWIEKNTLEIMYSNLLKYKVDLVHCQYKKFKNKEIIIPKNILNRNVKMNVDELEPQFFDLLYKTNICNSICKQLINKKIMKDIVNVNNDLLYNENLACNIVIYKKMSSILFIPDELYIYRKNYEGITKSMKKELIEKKIDDMCTVHHELYNSINEFNIKDKKYYKKQVCIKMLYQLTYLFYKLHKNSKFNKEELIEFIKNKCNQKQIKELLQYLSKNPDNINLKGIGKNTYNTTIYILEEKYNQLYYYYKFLYYPILFIEKKIKRR